MDCEVRLPSSPVLCHTFSMSWGDVPSSTRPGFLFSTRGLLWLPFWDYIWCIHGHVVNQQSAQACCVPGSVVMPGHMNQFSRTCEYSCCDLGSWPGCLNNRVTRRAVTTPGTGTGHLWGGQGPSPDLPPPLLLSHPGSPRWRSGDRC